jgi:hypothetical protein
MKRIISALTVLLLGVLVGLHIRSVQAQAATPVFQITGAWSPHTSCVPTTGQTTLCIASDGVWVSTAGAAFTQLGGGVSGVTSVTVNGGTAQTGAVTLSIPTQATTTSTTVLK